MNKIIAIVCASLSLMFAGCKSMPTPESLNTASYAVGVSTALVANMTKISDKDRQIVIDIVNDAKYYIPQSGESITEAWSAIAKNHVEKLVAKGEITEVEAVLILKTFDTVTSAVDYMIRHRWPYIGEYADLMAAMIHGFSDGFLTYFKPANSTGFSSGAVEYDKDAYSYLMSTRSK